MRNGGECVRGKALRFLSPWLCLGARVHLPHASLHSCPVLFPRCSLRTPLLLSFFLGCGGGGCTRRRVARAWPASSPALAAQRSDGEHGSTVCRLPSSYHAPGVPRDIHPGGRRGQGALDVSTPSTLLHLRTSCWLSGGADAGESTRRPPARALHLPSLSLPLSGGR